MRRLTITITTARISFVFNDSFISIAQEKQKNYLRLASTVTILPHSTAYHRERLVASLQRFVPVDILKGEELPTHWWAYRAMNALGVYDPTFKETYTATIGQRIDALLPKYGAWVSDNCLRNNTVTPRGLVIPIDFNSLQYGLWQMEDAGVVPFYLFPGPLELATGDEKNQVVDHMRAQHVMYSGKPTVSSDPDYDAAFLASTFYKNTLLAGYRTQEMGILLVKIEGDYHNGGFIDTDECLSFRKAYDEIEYHESILYQSLWQFPGAFASSQEQYNRVEEAISYTSQNTRHKRTAAMLSDAWGQINGQVQHRLRIRRATGRAIQGPFDF